jgi:anti-sigma factor RsiW
MSCREFTELLHEYLLANLPAGERAEFDTHLAECPACVAYLDGYRKAIQLAKEALSVPEDVQPPAEAPEELVRAVLRARSRAS